MLNSEAGAAEAEEADREPDGRNVGPEQSERRRSARVERCCRSALIAVAVAIVLRGG
jgi:hypothetical protein